MQLQNISVGKKIWLNLLIIMVILVGTGGGLIYSLNRVNQTVQQDVHVRDERIADAIRWRSAAELAINQMLAEAMLSEPHLKEAMKAKREEYMKVSTQLQQKLEREITHEDGKRQLSLIAAERNKLLTLFRTVHDLQSRGASTELQNLLEREVMPIAVVYNQAQRDLVTLQERVRDEVVAAGNDEIHRIILISTLVACVAVVVGLLAGHIVVRQITEPLDRAVLLANHIAGGDLTHDIHDERRDELGNLLRSLSTMTRKLRDAMGEVRNGVDSVSSTAGQIASGNMDLSSRTEQTAANLEQTAASMEQLTATVTQSADTARQANQLATTAVQAAERGGAVVEQVVHSMAQINTSSRKINDIIGVIDGIAFQTNILALNAAVEAARAGEQGRGFAVVAGEVRNLAQRSAEAAKEIKGLITTSVSNVDTGAIQVAQAGESMQEIVNSVRRVTDLIGEITASATEQRDGISQVNQAVNNLDQMTQQNAALVEESSAAASAMHEQAQRLASVVSMFNLGTMAHSRAVSVPASHSTAFVTRTNTAAFAGAKSPTQPPTPASASHTAKAMTSKLLTVSSLPKSSEAVDSSIVQTLSQSQRHVPKSSTKPAAKSAAVDNDDWETF